ncbi:unnamed protein product [Owenia fusiformis]|uniref:TauD/TfdA-like domain-containing protein n=1 Tax=Owenia fusiformis TaxID=6347 RepID=A0A8J1T7S9_OWEFU|nr:unnamed protein product [Owenia fusiformis]
MIRSITAFVRGAAWLQTRGAAQLAGRPFMPGGEGENFPKYLEEPRENFPVLVTGTDAGISPTDSPKACAEAVKEKLKDQLLKYGAILYRDFPIKNHDDFAEFFNNLGPYKSMDYKGGAAVRNTVGSQNKNVYTASREPPEWTIEPHNEMAYMSYWPKLILFYCDVPPPEGTGGESVICHVRDILEKLDPDVAAKFDKLGIRYSRHIADKSQDFYQSWQEVFRTEERGEAEKYLKETDNQWIWNEDGSINFWQTRPAFINHPITGEKLWFNHIHRKHASAWKSHPVWKKIWEEQNINDEQFPTHSAYGDGSPIPESVVQHIRDVSWEVAVGTQMKHKDVMVLENHLVQHARLSFTGQRKLLTILAEYA